MAGILGILAALTLVQMKSRSRIHLLASLAVAVLIGNCSVPRPEPVDVHVPKTPALVTHATSAPDPHCRLAVRIHRFLLKHGASPKIAAEMAPVFSRCKYPRVMAAISIVESRCDPYAVGSSGEVSMFQVLRWPGGNPADNVHALKVAISVLDEKRAATKSLRSAIRAYNGRGRRAAAYQRKVWKLIQKI